MLLKKIRNVSLGLATLPMQAPELAVIEAERCMKELGLKGFQIGSHVNDWNLSDPGYFRFMKNWNNWRCAFYTPLGYARAG